MFCHKWRIFFFVHILHLHMSLLTIELPVALWSVGAINEEKEEGPCKYHIYSILMGGIVLTLFHICFSSDSVSQKHSEIIKNYRIKI